MNELLWNVDISYLLLFVENVFQIKQYFFSW